MRRFFLSFTPDIWPKIRIQLSRQRTISRNPLFQPGRGGILEGVRILKVIVCDLPEKSPTVSSSEQPRQRKPAKNRRPDQTFSAVARVFRTKAKRDLVFLLEENWSGCYRRTLEFMYVLAPK